MAPGRDRSWWVGAIVVFAALVVAVAWLTGERDGQAVDVGVEPVEVIEGAEIEPPEVVVADADAEPLEGETVVDQGSDDASPSEPVLRPTGALDLGVSGAFRDGEVVVVGLRRVGEALGIPFFTMRPPQRQLVRHLEPGAYEVHVLAPDDVTGPPLAIGQVDVRADGTTPLSLEYAPGSATLRVRLVGDVPWFDELLGEPDVRLRRPGARFGAQEPIEEDWETIDGVEAMTIPDLAPGPRVVDIAPFGITREVVLTDGRTTDVDVVLDDLAWLVARPTDVSGFVAVTWGFVGSDDVYVVPHMAGVATWAVPERPIWVRAVGEQSSSSTVTLAPTAHQTSDVSLVCDLPGAPELTVTVSLHRHRHVLGRVFSSATDVVGPGRSLASDTERGGGLSHVCLLEHPGTYTLRHVVRLGDVEERDVVVERDGINIVHLDLPSR